MLKLKKVDKIKAQIQEYRMSLNLVLLIKKNKIILNNHYKLPL